MSQTELSLHSQKTKLKTLLALCLPLEKSVTEVESLQERIVREIEDLNSQVEFLAGAIEALTGDLEKKEKELVALEERRARLTSIRFDGLIRRGCFFINDMQQVGLRQQIQSIKEYLEECTAKQVLILEELQEKTKEANEIAGLAEEMAISILCSFFS